MAANFGILLSLFKQLWRLTFLKNLLILWKRHMITYGKHRLISLCYHCLSFSLLLFVKFFFWHIQFFFKVPDDCPGDLSFWYRHISKGAWPFSTADHGWPISDCTAEGLKVARTGHRLYFNIWFLFIILSFLVQASLLLSRFSPEIVGEPVDAKRLYDAVNVILSLMVNCVKTLVISVATWLLRNYFVHSNT